MARRYGRSAIILDPTFLTAGSMLRVRGDRETLLTALVEEWSNQLLGIPRQQPAMGLVQQRKVHLSHDGESIIEHS